MGMIRVPGQQERKLGVCLLLLPDLGLELHSMLLPAKHATEHPHHTNPANDMQQVLCDESSRHANTRSPAPFSEPTAALCMRARM